MYRRIGVSAGRRLQSIINFVETSWAISPCRKAVYFLRRRYADTPTRFPSACFHSDELKTQMTV
jgi:hypothetical protein